MTDAASTPLSFICRGCEARVAGDQLAPFSCPAASEGDDTDHVLARELDTSRVAFVDDGDANAFVAFRHLSAAHQLAATHGLSDGELVALIRALDARVAEVDGGGFRRTPFLRVEALEDAIGAIGPLWLKDETGNVSGSHKARHLMGIMLYLQVAERVGLLDAARRAPLAIASCGNAALAAAVVARAARWPLSVFVPPEAPRSTLSRLEALGAKIHVSARDPQRPAGDPCYLDFRAALAAGSLPFCCQGPDNGLTLEGGQTLGYELLTQLTAEGVEPDRMLIQVGGGALASATMRALGEARAWQLLSRLPRLHAIQTEGAFPLARAYERVVARLLEGEGDAPAGREAQALWVRDELDDSAIDAALRHAATHRSLYMQPWPDTPRSVASGILDDETYDWLEIVSGMLKSGGYPLVANEETLAAAHQAASAQTSIPVCATGSAGLAGLMTLQRAGALAPGETSVLLFTGHER